MRDGVATRLRPLLTRIFGADPPIRVLAWDGSEFGPEHAPCFVIRDRRALRRLLWKPGELGLARAFIAGELGIEGDFVAALGAVQEVMRLRGGPIRLSSDDKREIVRTAVMLGAVGPEPRPPAEEHTWARAMARPGAGTPVDPAVPPWRARWPRDSMAAHADELGSAFFEHVVGPELTATCGAWSAAHATAARASGGAGPEPSAE
jgi:cyclopropane-fatty-acyl-phospholipid synthase